MSRPEARDRAAEAVLYALALAAYAAFAWAFRHYTNDDAYITFRYSRNLAAGLGPFYNPGEAVEGYTNPSLMLTLAALAKVFGAQAIPGAARVIGIASGAFTVILAGRLARHLAARSELEELAGHAGAVGGLAALMLGLTPHFALNTLSGLETGPFAALLAASLLLALRPRPPRLALAALLAGLVWTRPEGPLIAAFVWLGVVVARVDPDVSPRQRMRDTLVVGGLVTAAFVAQLGARYLLYDGALVPNTFHAKAEGFVSVGLGEYAYEGIVRPFLGWPGVVASLVGLSMLPPTRTLRALIAGLAGPALALGVTGADWMMGWRFLMPLLAPLVAIVLLGWLRLALAAPVGGRLQAALVATVVLSCGAWQLPVFAELRDEVDLRARGYETGHIALAESVCAEAAPGETIALMDIGLVGFLCPEQRILDISGLTDAHIARSPGPFLSKEYDPAYVLDQEPRYVVLVLATPGESYLPPPADAEFSLWTTPERRLFAHPDFQRAYRRVRAEPAWTTDWLGALAARLGAVRVYEHAHPGTHYLLALFERR